MYKSGDFIKVWISGLYFFLTQFSGANFEQSKSCPLAAAPVAPFHAPKLSFAIIPRRMLFSLKRTYWGGLAFQESLTTCKCHLCSKNVPCSVLPSWSLRYRSLWPPVPNPQLSPLIVMHWAPKFRHGQRGNCFLEWVKWPELSCKATWQESLESIWFISVHSRSWWW